MGTEMYVLLTLEAFHNLQVDRLKEVENCMNSHVSSEGLLQRKVVQ